MAEMQAAADLVSKVLPRTPIAPITQPTTQMLSQSSKPNGTPASCPKCHGFGWLQYDVR